MDPNLLEFLKQMAAQQQQMAAQQQQMAQLMERIHPPQPAVVAQPLNLHKLLSDRMCTFSYVPEENQTFDRFYARYETIFRVDAAAMLEAQKVDLLTEKLTEVDYQKFADAILPDTKANVTFEKTVSTLKRLFGRKESLFSLRYKCLTTEKTSGENSNDFAARVKPKM